MVKIENSGLVITKDIIGLIRKTLIENLGYKKASKFLMKFGNDLGREKAIELLNIGKSPREIIDAAMAIHAEIGHISRTERHGRVERTKNGLYFNNTHGMWFDSFEVSEHLKNFGKSDSCVCNIVSGFMSGVTSIAFGVEAYVKEMTCVARGDENCTFITDLRTEWERKGEDLPIYNNETFINELETTYDKLVEKTNLLDEMIHFHDKITDSVAQQNDIKQVIDTAASILNIPIIILNLKGKLMFENSYYEQLGSIDLSAYIKNLQETKTIILDNHKFVITPIHLDYKRFAYCSFIYNKNDIILQNDVVYLERLAVASSLCFLNEKVSFEATERFKINFLDRLVYKHFTSEDESIIHANYIEPKITAPYQLFTMKINGEDTLSVDQYDILISIARDLKKYQIHVLLTKKIDDIIIFVYDFENQNYLSTIKKVIKNTLKDRDYKVGVSNEFHELKDFQIALEQAEKSMNFPTKEKYMLYNKLGIYSDLLQNVESEHLLIVAKQQLKTLLDDNEKDRILLHTLYVYLKNNQKLEKTMEELSLSIGGIKYRLRKIESIIGKKLKDASTFAFLLILIESLLLANLITFE